ncbi:hypothetical protein KV953_004644 [Salmonella enterica]|nr:hypothetical protein [Salmonella enterica]
MALPKEFKVERSKYLEEQYKKYKITELENLTTEDFRMLGVYIQTYCFIELNIQRVFQKLNENGIIKINKGNKINIPYMMNVLKKSINQVITEPSEISLFIENLGEIELRRSYRNIFAHWAAKRIPKEDAMVFITSNAQDYKKVIGKEMNSDYVAYAILDIADIRGLIVHLLEYDKWLAEFTGHLYGKFQDE